MAFYRLNLQGKVGGVPVGTRTRDMQSLLQTSYHRHALHIGSASLVRTYKALVIPFGRARGIVSGSWIRVTNCPHHEECTTEERQDLRWDNPPTLRPPQQTSHPLGAEYGRIVGAPEDRK